MNVYSGSAIPAFRRRVYGDTEWILLLTIETSENGNENSGSIKGEKYFQHVSEY
jgi:hypothetical protein